MGQETENLTLIQPNQEEIEQEQNDQLALQQRLSEFNQDIGEVFVKYRERVPLSHMAKVCLGTAVDLILNQGALQAQYTVQEMLAPLFQQLQNNQEEKEPSRIYIP